MGAAICATSLEQRCVLPHEARDIAEELLGLVLELALAEQPADDAAEVELLALILSFQLIFELALAEQAADDAAEVELLALLLVLEFRLVLELGLGLQFGLA